MKLLVTLLLCLMLMVGCVQEQRAMVMWDGDKQIVHVKHTQADLDVKLSSTEPGRIVVKVIDSKGRTFKCASASNSQDNQVTEITFDSQHEMILINGNEHPYYNKGEFVLKDNKLIKM